MPDPMGVTKVTPALIEGEIHRARNGQMIKLGRSSNPTEYVRGVVIAEGKILATLDPKKFGTDEFYNEKGFFLYRYGRSGEVTHPKRELPNPRDVWDLFVYEAPKIGASKKRKRPKFSGVDTCVIPYRKEI